MFDFSKLLSSKYLFYVDPVMMTRSDKAFLVVGIVAIILAVVFKIAAHTSQNPIDKSYRQRFFNIFLTVGIWEVLWFGFRYQNIKIFGTHFVALIGLLVGLAWFIKVVIDIYKHYSVSKKQWTDEQIKLKYLP